MKVIFALGGLTLKYIWERVSLNLLDTSQYSGRSYCCSLDGLDSFTDFEFLPSFFQAFGNHSKCTNYGWYHRHPHVTNAFFLVSIFSLSFISTLWSVGMAKSIRWLVFSFLLIHTKFGCLAGTRWFVCISKSQRIFISYSLGRILVCIYTIWQYGQILISCAIPSGSPFPPSRAWSCTHFVLVCYIRLLYDKPFHLFPHITYTCYSVVHNKFFALIYIYIYMGIFCAAIKRDSVSLLRLPFCSYI